jgi:hypothetical protein
MLRAQAKDSKPRLQENDHRSSDAHACDRAEPKAFGSGSAGTLES